MPRPQRLRSGRQPQSVPAFRIDRMRELAGNAVGDERMHGACGIEPAVFELGVTDAGLAHELAEVRFDPRGLLQAHEVRDYRHAFELIVEPIELAGMEWWAV
jgi:hypothetical protein